jgi:hypothetical protein
MEDEGYLLVVVRVIHIFSYIKLSNSPENLDAQEVRNFYEP